VLFLYNVNPDVIFQSDIISQLEYFFLENAISNTLFSPSLIYPDTKVKNCKLAGLPYRLEIRLSVLKRISSVRCPGNKMPSKIFGFKIDEELRVWP
jgi:hypothetical protein